jgi:hypothetical protein
MEVSKYYTPTIEEFHVGFECERKMEDLITFLDEWKRYTVDKYTWSSNQMGLMVRDHPEAFRVKYLDKEDIESLGWVIIEDRGMEENQGFHFTKRDPNFGIANYSLKYWSTNNRIKINSLIGTWFDGTIKNKSELKVLLKQLGIDGNTERGQDTKSTEDRQGLANS